MESVNVGKIMVRMYSLKSPARKTAANLVIQKITGKTEQVVNERTNQK